MCHKFITTSSNVYDFLAKLQKSNAKLINYDNNSLAKEQGVIATSTATVRISSHSRCSTGEDTKSQCCWTCEIHRF